MILRSSNHWAVQNDNACKFERVLCYSIFYEARDYKLFDGQIELKLNTIFVRFSV